MNIMENFKTYQEVKKKICKRLINDWQPNDRLPPIKVLARDMGAGQASTHHAIRELVGEGFLVSRPRMGTFVNNNLDKNMRTKLEYLIGSKEPPVKLPLENKKIQIITYRHILEHQTFFMASINAFMDAISPSGCKIVTTLIDPTTQETPLDKTADGVIVFNPSGVFQIQCLPSQVLTVVSPSSECMVTMGERFDLIAPDDIQGSLLVGQYLKKKGWMDNVAFMGARNKRNHEIFDKISLKRLEGLNLGLGDTIPSEWYLYCDSYGRFEAACVVQKWLKLSPRPSAIFTASDDLAYGFISGALSHGFLPGRDYQIFGFDAQQYDCFYHNLILTSISIPILEMGTVAASMLMKRLENPKLSPQRIFLGCHIFEGNTVMPR